MLVKVNVTQEDIDNGDPLSGENGPVVLAIRRCTSYSSVKMIFRSQWSGNHYTPLPVRIVLNDKTVYVPAEVSAWAKKLYDGESIQPFSFDLEIP